MRRVREVAVLPAVNIRVGMMLASAPNAKVVEVRHEENAHGPCIRIVIRIGRLLWDRAYSPDHKFRVRSERVAH